MTDVPAPIPSSTVMYRLGGRTYPMKRVKNCKVCNSNFRAAVENYLILGYSLDQIVKALPSDASLEVHNIRSHIDENHLPLAEEARRIIIEKRASELQWDPNLAAERGIDHIGFLRLALNDVYTQLATRQIQPDLKDGVAIAKALAQIDIDRDTEDQLANYVAGIRVVLENARKHMDDESFRAFSADVLQNETIRALTSRPAPKAISPSEEIS